MARSGVLAVTASDGSSDSSGAATVAMRTKADVGITFFDGEVARDVQQIAAKLNLHGEFEASGFVVARGGGGSRRRRLR